jgi:hypothetical protein
MLMATLRVAADSRLTAVESFAGLCLRTRRDRDLGHCRFTSRHGVLRGDED